MITLIPRISCDVCGWYNNKPSKKAEQYARCDKCGKHIIKAYRQENPKREFAFELHKNLYKLRQKC